MKSLEKFKLVHEVKVRWGDMDAFHHVNNTVYLKWVEFARVEYLTNHVTGPFKEKILGPILARQDIRYIFPITYPDTVIIAYKVLEILEDRIMCECRIYSKTHQRISAIVFNTIMPYNFQNLKKAFVPKDWIDRIHDFEGVIKK